MKGHSAFVVSKTISTWELKVSGLAAVVVIVFTAIVIAAAPAEHAKTASKKRSQSAEKKTARSGSPNTESAAAVVDRDESSEGEQRLTELVKHALRLTTERDQVDSKRRPYVVRRDSMLGEIRQAQRRLVQESANAAAMERQLARLEFQVHWMSGPIQKSLRSQESKLRTALNTLLRQIKKDRDLIEKRQPEIYALNAQIGSFDQRLRSLENEVAECRKQWLQIRQPINKYACADFEGLQRVVDDWLVLDGQWPEAYAWAALCAFEQDKFSEASQYLDKARALHADQFHSKKMLPQLEALTALIRSKQPGQRSKADASMANAISRADKNSDWETYFLVGRCYLDRPADGVRAKNNFLRALEIQPQCDCAKLWLGRLQTVSMLPEVRDPSAGVANLEELWFKSGERSWRLACFLADAYAAAERTADANSMWAIANKLAPSDQKYRISRYRVH